MKLLKHKWTLIFIFFLLTHFFVNGEIMKKNGSAKLTLQKANIAYLDAKYSIAVDYYNVYLQDNENEQYNILPKLADCYWQMRNYEKALQTYKLMYPSGYESKNKQDNIRIAELYARERQYHVAAKWLKNATGFNSRADTYNDDQAIEKMKKDSLNWKLGFSSVNSNFRDFSPFLKDSMLFFTSNKPLTVNSSAFAWDENNYSRLWNVSTSIAGIIQQDKTIYTTTSNVTPVSNNQKLASLFECGGNKITNNIIRSLIKTGEVEGKPNQIGMLVNGLENEKYNTATISIDKNNHVYFSSNYKKSDITGINRICLMEGVYSADGISKIKKLPFGNPRQYSVMHPTVNADGTILICSSNMPNGKGGFDLYYSTRIDRSEKWSSLKSFNDNVNTIGNDVFPAITNDGYLYFSSDARPGLGGLDIYKIRLNDALKGAGEVVHLSYPINSSSDDFGWTQDSTGTKGYFTSDRFSNNDNIYSFNYFERKDIGHNYIAGFVKDKDSFMPLQTSTVFIYNVNEDSVSLAKTDKDGKYQIEVAQGSKLILKAVSDHYLSDCVSINATVDTIQNVPCNLFLSKLTVGSIIRLDNLNYDFNKANIRPDAAHILDTLVAFLMKQPVDVEVGSHTDSRGSFAYNERLSQHRADSVAAYLVKKGIKSTRIISKGYGETKLLNKCGDGMKCSEDQHQLNRRTEIKIVRFTPLNNLSNITNADKFKNGDKIQRNLLPEDFFDECNLRFPQKSNP
jgi:outer membrane protein OmpA-like peptidoglycan-associated protein